MNRLMVLAGRFGTVIIAVSLALLLVSVLPTQEHVITYNTSRLPPSRFHLFGFPLTLNPKQGVGVTMNSSDELTVYVVQSNYSYIMDWLQNNSAGNQSLIWDTNMLEAFFGNHTDVISYQINVTGEAEFKYTPTTVEQAMLIFANYGNVIVTYEYRVSQIISVAPSVKILTAAETIIPIGLVLTAPWLFSLWREKNRRVSKTAIVC